MLPVNKAPALPHEHLTIRILLCTVSSSRLTHVPPPLAAVTPAGLEGLSAIMVGTTQFVNAVIERKHLAKVFVVRLCGSATAALPPFVGMPADLVRQISAGYLLAPGESHISKPLAAPAQQHL